MKRTIRDVIQSTTLMWQNLRGQGITKWRRRKLHSTKKLKSQEPPVFLPGEGFKSHILLIHPTFLCGQLRFKEKHQVGWCDLIPGWSLNLLPFMLEVMYGGVEFKHHALAACPWHFAWNGQDAVERGDVLEKSREAHDTIVWPHSSSGWCEIKIVLPILDANLSKSSNIYIEKL